MNVPPIEYLPMPKIARLNREFIITEKIDGTNACVHIDENGNIFAGSKNRWITPKDDNFGFAAWVLANSDALRTLGPGTHRGEWYGCGIGRKYGLDHRRFALFNTTRWSGESVPACCEVVPVLGYGTNISLLAQGAVEGLRQHGSRAVPGFMRPEGIIAYHTASNMMFKVTLEKDDVPKSLDD